MITPSLEQEIANIKDYKELPALTRDELLYELMNTRKNLDWNYDRTTYTFQDKNRGKIRKDKAEKLRLEGIDCRNKLSSYMTMLLLETANRLGTTLKDLDEINKKIYHA